MFHKRMIFAVGGSALCLAMLAIGLMVSVSGHSHAAGSHPIPRAHRTSTAALAPFDGVQGTIYYGVGNNSVFALDAQTGKQLWLYPQGCAGPDPFDNVIWVVSGVAYVNTCNPSCPSHLVALRGSDGTQLWCSNYTFFAPGAGGTRFLGVSAGIVYLYTVIPQGDGGEHDTVHALNAADGALLWSYDQNPQISDQLIDFFKAVPGAAYISLDEYNPTGGGARMTCALNTSSGSENWCANVITSVLAHGVLYAPNSTSLVALRASDGSQLWSFSGSFGYIVVHPNVVFAGGSSLCALNVSDGSQRWCSSSNINNFLVQGGVIYALQNSSSLRAFSASTGALLWTNLAQSIIGLSSSAIYVLTSTNQVQGINITNGALLWSYNAAQNGTASFGPGDGVIYYNTTHGLRALSAGTGTLLWSHFTPATVYSYFQSDSNGIAYVVTDDTAKNAITLHAYNATKGSLLWKYAL